VLLTLFLDRFGMEGLEWDPSTMALEIEEEFNVKLSQGSLDKLIVCIQILTTDRFFKNLPDFISFCNVLGDDTYRPDMWDPADAEEIAWGVTEALMIEPPDENDPDPFTNEIRSYIGAVLDSEGIINPPDILRIAMRNNKVSKNITDFSDDPEMFNAVYELEAGKTEDINNTLRMKTKLLAEQMAALNLKNGNTQNVVEMLNNVHK